MAYVTVTQLKASLANAGGAGSRTAAQLPDDRLQAAVDEATSEVTGRLTRSFTLPDPGEDPATSPESIPALMRTIIVGIAGYLATLEFFGSQPVEERDPVVLRYARAEKLLAQVANGDLKIDELEPTAGEGTSPTGDAATYGGTSTGLAEGWLEDMDHAGRHVSAPYSGGASWG